MLDPRLVRLRAELEQLGSVVVPHGERICVRLPLATSVVVRIEHDALRCHPQIGPFARSSALGGTAVATTAGVIALLATGGLAAPIALAVGGMSTMMVQIGAFVLADHAISRIQSAWLRVRGSAGDATLPPLGEPRALREPVPDELARLHGAGERRA